MINRIIKFKVKALANEAKELRKRENNRKKFISEVTQAQSFKHQKDAPRPEERKDWPEFRFERPQYVVDQAFAELWGLQHRRTHYLRKEARKHHLIYGFIRGVPYEMIEQGAYSIPDLKELEDIARLFCFHLQNNEFINNWNIWVENAKKYYEEKGNLNRSVEEIATTIS